MVLGGKEFEKLLGHEGRAPYKRELSLTFYHVKKIQ
jgi:hypothetical protein